MKISVKALYALLRESIQNNRIISERPWAVEYTFTLSGKSAEDSEGSSADGFSIDMTSSSGTTSGNHRLVLESSDRRPVRKFNKSHHRRRRRQRNLYIRSSQVRRRQEAEDSYLKLTGRRRLDDLPFDRRIFTSHRLLGNLKSI